MKQTTSATYTIHATRASTKSPATRTLVTPPPANIVLLGTNHVSVASERAVLAEVPRADVVAIELDRGRAEGLLSGKRATFNELRKHLGIRTALFAITLRWLQERIAAHLDVAPGIDMKAALIAASNHKKTVALIDRDIAVTMHRLRSSFGFRELLQLFRDVFRRRTIPLDPSDDVVLGVLAEMHERYPRLYTALVTERDEYMASALVNLATRYPGKRILAIVGKGHVPGMLTQIRYLNAAASVSAWTSTGKSA